MSRLAPLVLLPLLVCAHCESATGGARDTGGTDEGAERVLLIGNSQLGLTEYDCDLAQALTELAGQAGGRPLQVDRVQVNGKDCAGFLAAGSGPEAPRARAASGDYDVVLLFPALDEPYDGSEACFETFRAAAEGAGSRFGVVATAHMHSGFPRGFVHMRDGQRAYARAHDLLFIPGGDVWLELLGPTPSPGALEALYSRDYAHPGVKGSYMYVLAMLSALRERSAVGLPRDLAALRCDPAAPCLPLAALEACAARGDCGDENGVQRDARGQVSVITAADAAAMQAAVDAALSR